MKNIEYSGLVQYFEPYWDYDFFDDDSRNIYCITYIESEDVWYGVHRKSETPESDFDDGVYMSRTDVDICRGLIPESDMPRSKT